MNPPMRMLILLAVFGAAGSLLLAAESPPTSTPTADRRGQAARASRSIQDRATPPTRRPQARSAKTETRKRKGSIAEQAEAALKAAAEADAGARSQRTRRRVTSRRRRTTRRRGPQAAPAKRLRRSASCRPSRFAPTSTSHSRSTSDATEHPHGYRRRTAPRLAGSSTRASSSSRCIALIFTILVVHATYVAWIRPNGDAIIAAEQARMRGDPNYVPKRSFFLRHQGSRAGGRDHPLHVGHADHRLQGAAGAARAQACSIAI